MTKLFNSKGNQVGECHHEGIRIDIGCGNARDRAMIGLDFTPGEQVDIARDLTRGLPFCDRSVAYIKAHNILEHIEGNANFEGLIRECWRVLQDDGVIDIVVPGAMSDGGMRDPTHARHFMKSTFDYFKAERPRHHSWMPDCPWIVVSVEGANDGTITAMMTPDRPKQTPTIDHSPTPPLHSPTANSPENGPSSREGEGS